MRMSFAIAYAAIFVSTAFVSIPTADAQTQTVNPCHKICASQPSGAYARCRRACDGGDAAGARQQVRIANFCNNQCSRGVPAVRASCLVRCTREQRRLERY